MCFRNFPYFILILQMIRFTFQGEIVTSLTIRHRITQQGFERRCFDHVTSP